MKRRPARPSNVSGIKASAGFRTSPHFLRLAIESLSEYALITLGADLRISSWSGPACVIFGYSEAEIIGREVSVLFTPEDIAQGIDKSEFEGALKNGRQDDERWHVRKDGRRLWCYGLSFPLKDEKGKVRGFVKLIRDDSPRKEKDDRLRASEERLSLAAESTGLGTWDFDVANRTLILSTRAAELFGLGREPKSPGFEQFVEMVHPDDRKKISTDFNRCVVAGGPHELDMEYRILMADGRVRWIRTLARAFVDGGPASGPPTRLIGTVIDVTEQRATQDKERGLSRELEQRVKDRTARLTALNKELESFAYSASHDLRAPLRQIAAFSQAILEGRSELAAEYRAWFERIRAATTKMHRLIDDMLVLSRVTRKPLEEADCDLSAIAREIVSELHATDADRRVDWVIADGARAHGDRDFLRLALRNLLENAWKFTSRHPRARIEFGTALADGHPVYFVKDDGAGFEMRYAEKLFEAFVRLHPEDQFPGTGVGLGIVERIVRRHQGRLWAEAAVERGATFFFTLHTEEG